MDAKAWVSLFAVAAGESRLPAALAHAAYLAFVGTTARKLGGQDDSEVPTRYDLSARST